MQFNVSLTLKSERFENNYFKRKAIDSIVETVEIEEKISFILSRTTHFYLFSIFPTLQEAPRIKLTKTMSPGGQTVALKVSWLHKVYQKNWEPVPFSQNDDNTTHLRLVEFHMRNKSFKYIFYHSFRIRGQLKSWIQAAKLCQEGAGHLPTLRSRDEQHELVSLVRLSHHIPFVEALFIGLDHQVSFFAKFLNQLNF